MAQGDLTTVQDVKDWLKITVPDDDGLLQRLVTSLSAYAANRCGRTFQPTTYTKVLDGWGGRAYMFPNRPATAVASVTICGTLLNPTTDYVWDDLSLRLKYGSFPLGVGNVVIVYTGGFAKIPVDLGDAIAEMCAWAYKERDRIGVDSKTIGEETVRFLKTIGNTRCVDVIDNYTKADPS